MDLRVFFSRSRRSSQVFLFLCILAKCAFSMTDHKLCPRDQSRVVARIVRKQILPAFRSVNVQIESKCPFSLQHDMYAIQEGNKVFEGSGRWTCDFCGKAFVSEFFLDKHFENRHADQLQTENSICLAEECDVFRCDIISGVSVPDYWDIALCLEDDMEDLMAQCQELVDKCVPKGLTKNQTETLKNAITDSVCSFLNCKEFWNTPFQQEENPHTALYIVLTTMTCFGILIYNFVFYNYFYSDYFDTPYDPSPRTKHKIKPYSGNKKTQKGSPLLKNRGQIIEMESA